MSSNPRTSRRQAIALTKKHGATGVNARSEARSYNSTRLYFYPLAYRFPPPPPESTPVAWQLLRSRLTSANNGETLISCDWARRTVATKATNGMACRGRGCLERDDPLSLSPRLFLAREPFLEHSNSLCDETREEEKEREEDGKRKMERGCAVLTLLLCVAAV